MSPAASEQQPKQPLEDPELSPKGGRTPYAVDEPVDPKGAGSEPDYFPGKPGNDQPKFRIAARRPRFIVGPLQAN
jgi:hypothetical protein